MKWIRVVGLVVLIGGLCAVLSGCGYRELHQRILIQGIGVDKTSRGYRVTVRAASSEEETGEELYTCQGASVLEALSSLSLSTGREPFYSHNYLVVFGRSCGEEGLDKSMDFFIRYYNTRPAVQMYLAEDTAEEILSAKRDDQFVPIQELQNLGKSGKYNGKAVSVDFLEFVNGASRPGSSPVLPVLGIKQDRVELLGTAYFQKYQLAGFLTLDQTRGYLAMKGTLKSGELVVQGEDFGTRYLDSFQRKRKTGSRFSRECSNFSDSVSSDRRCKRYFRRDLFVGEEFYTAVEREVAQQLEKEMNQVLEQVLLEDQCDIFGFGNYLSQRYPKRWEALFQNWEEEMTRCQYEVQVEATVLRMEQGGL